LKLIICMFIKQISFQKLVIFHSDMKPCDTKGQVKTQKQDDIEIWLNHLPNIHILRKKPNK